jgi:hypothetical protein
MGSKTGGVDQHDRGHVLRVVAGKLLGVETAKRMSDQNHGLADVQCLQQLMEIRSRRIGSDRTRPESGALAKAAPVLDKHAGDLVQRVNKSWRPRLHVVANAGEQDQQRTGSGGACSEGQSFKRHARSRTDDVGALRERRQGCRHRGCCRADFSEASGAVGGAHLEQGSAEANETSEGDFEGENTSIICPPKKPRLSIGMPQWRRMA